MTLVTVPIAVRNRVHKTNDDYYPVDADYNDDDISLWRNHKAIIIISAVDASVGDCGVRLGHGDGA